MARCMVTGGAGFIGSHVCEFFADSSFEVLVIDNLSTGKRCNIPSACNFIHGDITEKGLLQEVVSEFNPNLVIHLAAQSSVTRSVDDPSLDLNVNVIGTLLLLESLKNLKQKPRLIYSSTGVNREKMISILNDGNRSWASKAPLLVFVRVWNSSKWPVTRNPVG